jgi:hypothetical protein
MWKLAKSKAGMTGTAGAVIGVVIAVVVIVAVAIPVTQSIIDDANLTGTTATIVNLIPLFLGLAGLVVVAALFA